MKNMATIAKASDTFTRLHDGFPSMLTKVIQDNGRELGSYVREQLWAGLDGNEKELRPTYLTDPYFKERYGSAWRLMAERYADWKMEITPPSMGGGRLGFRPRPRVVPNLFIDGTFHRSIEPRNIENGISFHSDVGFASDIERKYHDDIYKISRTARKHFIDNVVSGAVKLYWS